MQQHTDEPSPYAPGDRTGANGQAPIQNPTDALRDISQQLAELKSYAAYYLAAKSDSIKGSLRNVGIYAGLGIVGLIAFGSLVAMAVALLCLGIAHGIAALTGHGWIGDLVAGVLLLGLIAGAVIFGLRAVTSSSRKRTIEKYEKLQQEQRLEFGSDVHQTAQHGK